MNYVVELGKQWNFSLVGIQGADITDGQRTLTLGMVWQLMRKDITNTLSSLAQKLGKRDISDSDMVQWANNTVSKGGRSSAVRSSTRKLPTAEVEKFNDSRLPVKVKGFVSSAPPLIIPAPSVLQSRRVWRAPSQRRRGPSAGFRILRRPPAAA